jgi:TRAP-type mannitol/chloroaromatic compound transport system permease small subunit
VQRLADAIDMVNIRIARAVRWFALVMAVGQFAIVVGRYAFGVYSIAAQEAVLYLHSSLFMLGAGWTLLVDRHVRVDILYGRASPQTRRRIDILGHLLLLQPAMWALVFWSWPSVRNAWAILEGPISVGGIPAVFLLKSLIPAFALLVALQSLALMLRLLGRARA